MNSFFKQSIGTLGEMLKLFILGAVLLYGASLVSAWTGPTAAPPGGNVPAPINVGSVSQVKAGGLWAASFGADGGATFGGNVGIGTVTPGKKLDVVGAVRATGDVCTDLAGGKCLSTAAGGALNNLECKSYDHPGGMSSSDFCGTQGGFCTGTNYYSSFEWFPRGCEYTEPGGKINCCVPR